VRFLYTCVVDACVCCVALASLYAPHGKFALHEIDDAVEALEAIFNQIHASTSGGDATGNVSADAFTTSCCVAHRVFGLMMREQATCVHCNTTTAPQQFMQVRSGGSLVICCD
jgi:hypothetical protein